MNAIPATQETQSIARSLNNYANFCNKKYLRDSLNMKYYLRDVVDCALLIAFFFTAADNTNKFAKHLFDSTYVLTDHRPRYDYVEIYYANVTIEVPGVSP
jgi:hypothetical protein